MVQRVLFCLCLHLQSFKASQVMANIEADLRHMTSAGHLSSQRSPHRASQQARLGSRSPNSIPSSPTSVHSSSSAIFERDIEPIVPPSPPFLAHQNPHRIPRAKGTEQLENSVPSVLDSAASLLATLEESGETVDHVSIVAPASTSPALDLILARGTNSGFASPIGSFRSRSPSPLGLRVATGPGPIPRTDLLLNIPSASVSSQVNSGQAPALSSSPQRPTVVGVGSNPALTPLPAIITPTSGLISTEASRESSPTTSTACDHTTMQVAVSPPPSTSSPSAPSELISSSPSTSPPLPTQPGTTTTAAQLQQQQPHHHVNPIPTSSGLTSASVSMTSPTSWTSTLSHPPSPTSGPAKRLSFMSYSDLLSSTPASTLSLSSLTTSASSAEPPPHIPSVSGLNFASAAQAQGVQLSPAITAAAVPFAGGGAPITGSSVRGVVGGGGGGAKTSSTATSLRGFVMGPMGGLTHPGKRDSIAMLDDVGGEWEREGLGRGLEERLEALIALPPPQIPLNQPAVVTKT